MLRCVARLASDHRVEFHLTPQQVSRRLRLFYCACCRMRWDALSAEARAAVEVAERRADGLEGRREWADARRYAVAAERAARRAAGWQPAPERVDAARLAALVASAVSPGDGPRGRGVRACCPAGADVQAALLGDLFGDPFDPFDPVVAGAGWRTGEVVGLARQVRAGREFHLMPVLGDALQDAGCDRPDVLDHCYAPGAHVLGCHVVDAVLGFG